MDSQDDHAVSLTQLVEAPTTTHTDALPSHLKLAARPALVRDLQAVSAPTPAPSHPGALRAAVPEPLTSEDGSPFKLSDHATATATASGTRPADAGDAASPSGQAAGVPSASGGQVHLGSAAADLCLDGLHLLGPGSVAGGQAGPDRGDGPTPAPAPPHAHKHAGEVEGAGPQEAGMGADAEDGLDTLDDLELLLGEDFASASPARSPAWQDPAHLQLPAMPPSTGPSAAWQDAALRPGGASVAASQASTSAAPASSQASALLAQTPPQPGVPEPPPSTPPPPPPQLGARPPPPLDTPPHELALQQAEAMEQSLLTGVLTCLHAARTAPRHNSRAHHTFFSLALRSCMCWHAPMCWQTPALTN